MSETTTVYCQVHRFHEYVAVYVGGKTIYMTPEEAQTLAQGLLAHAHDAMVTPFGKLSMATFSLEVPKHLP